MRKLTILFALLMLSVGVWAETIDGVKYLDANGVEQTANGVNEITNTSTTLAAGWYVVNGTDVQTGTLVCQGAVNLILADNAKLTATGDGIPGIQVSSTGNSLKIYAQSTDPDQIGQLEANGGQWAAGIGGGENGNGSNITINGGKVEATGGEHAAGIGGGRYGYGENITINGGKVTANGGAGGAGIGGGANGIGGGLNGYGRNITINGGEISATGGKDAAGIGGGYQGSGFEITINGGKVTANGGMNAAGIGGGKEGGGINIFVAADLVVKADGNNPPTTIIENTGSDLSIDLAGKRYVTVEPAPAISTTYIDENGIEQTVDAWEVKSASKVVTWGTVGQTTWYVVNGTDVQLAKGAICQGDVRLILADGAKLTATGIIDETNGIYTPGIQVSGEGNSLKIYAQSTDPSQMGQLEAHGGQWAAGIGGGKDGNGFDITINGGIVTANGGYLAAGIGGGLNGNGVKITINGVVTATGGEGAAGIGGGYLGSGSNITINGGKVTATGGYTAAGIGGGYQGSGSNITINGGEIIATGGAGAAGIGGGLKGNGEKITINGVVTANGGENAIGIGGGMDGDSDLIFVAADLVVRADNNNPPTTIIENTGSNLSSDLKGKRYVTIDPSTKITLTAEDFTVTLPENLNYDGTEKKVDVKIKADYEMPESSDITIYYNNDKQVKPINPGTYQVYIDINRTDTYNAVRGITSEAWKFTIIDPLLEYKAAAIAEIQAAGEGIQNENLNNWINGAINDINSASTDTKEKVDNIKNQILPMIQLFQDGRAVGKAEALGNMGEPCTDCTAVKVTKGDKTVTLYAPESVDYEVIE